jgi:hypothetical protein
MARRYGPAENTPHGSDPALATHTGADWSPRHSKRFRDRVLRVADEGITSEPLSDVEQVVLRELRRALVVTRNLTVGDAPERELPTTETLAVTSLVTTPHTRRRVGTPARASAIHRVCGTGAASLNPDGKLS